MKMRLRENHPAMVALEELCQEFYKQGIIFYWDIRGITVKFVGGQEYKLQDIEIISRDSFNWGVDCFPPSTEYKLVYEKEENEN